MSSSRVVAWIARVSVAIIVALGVIGWLRPRAPAAQPPTGAKPLHQAESPIPVRLATVERRDLPVWLEGPGTVAASQEVTVRPQVDGRLDAVTFVEGQAVKKGAVIARIDPRPFESQLHQAEGQLARDTAQLDAARADLQRVKSLHAQGLIAGTTVDVTEGQARTAEAAVKLDDAQLENAQLLLDYAAIKAPLTGIAGVRRIDAGNLVHATDTAGLVVITAIDPAAVVFTLPEDRLAEITAALAAGDVPVEVWTRDGTQRLASAKLALLDNQVDAATSTLRLKALVPNRDRRLWPNAAVRARVLVRTEQHALVVPSAAVQHDQTGTYVYVAGADGTARRMPVTVAVATRDASVIEKGLAGTEQVVVEGADRLHPGARLAM